MEPFRKLQAEGGEIYQVGGAVRDSLLGIVPKDQDLLIRGLPIPLVLHILQAQGSVEIVGSSFRVLKFIAGDTVYDIAFPRPETAPFPSPPFPEGFDPDLPLEADLIRRDFTINTMARRVPDGELVDPLNGARDLEARVLRMASQGAFETDPLRILRGAQLTARFELNVDADTFNHMRDKAPLLKSVAPERLMEELVKVLVKSRRPSTCFDLLREVGALPFVSPALAACIGVTQNRYHAHDVYRHTMAVIDALPADLELRLAGLYHDVGKVRTRSVGHNGEVHFYGHEEASTALLLDELTRLRFPNAVISNAGCLVRHHLQPLPEGEGGARRFVARIGPDLASALLTLKEADSLGKGKEHDPSTFSRARHLVEQVMERKAAVTVRQLAINGHDLLALGIPEGPAMGRILSALLDRVVDLPHLNTRQSLLEMARLLTEERK